MGKAPMDTEQAALRRVEAYGRATLVAAKELADNGADPAEIAVALLNASLALLEDLASRDQVRRALVALADSLIDRRAN